MAHAGNPAMNPSKILEFKRNPAAQAEEICQDLSLPGGVEDSWRPQTHGF